jgi:hypothetical protein
MFTKLGPNAVQASNGFKVERTGRNQLKYSEAQGYVLIEVEPGDGLAVYLASISHWIVGNEKVWIDPKERESIARNVERALEFLRIPYVVVS